MVRSRVARLRDAREKSSTKEGTDSVENKRRKEGSAGCFLEERSTPMLRDSFYSDDGKSKHSGREKMC